MSLTPCLSNVDCIFCKIIKKEIPSDIVYEDSDVVVFKDIHPKAPIHHLVVPKAHIQSIAHLEANHNEIISKLIYVAKRVAQDEDLAGYKLVFNVGREGGQVVDHLHLHLLGGWGKEKDQDKFRV
ncbi:MAG: histidine triad nucleotide-binding protein [Candidatus Sungbacteria bacterium RIFCSPLOWO2_12_FULL_41_11]|uniref:Histidine triad nucleotide-binding protein n=1 Tax=Candidatus Sungbacteria bacterium RIFCSPLOWO2_12_FULL_41_11 TaxID=1802286 RepID=A0A1G2LQZ0_9BACT|nr:MAG: HIT family hydrolase, diadenosine tetraphosphate hydrolase [Parcubacteria group bacterium GW2011_GWA2_42_14]OGZ97393.1 MAG: histidine triad nucleotide-binding protein [Candidatus Sungbacteria bacterium RIFCSPHIGHO2_02_FULL_41_12b]OHA13272.1 MAG: histidine triad nucleotide-binding protein [Candidatus Sungbacteria bacterium RIFCSPLOWO2_12_FULL_41_11]